MDSRGKTFLCVVIVCVIGIALMVGIFLDETSNTNSVKRAVEQSSVSEATADVSQDIEVAQDQSYIKDSFDGSITYEGEKYEVNTAIDTVLFLGIDSSDQERNGAGIKEGGRSDTIILFVIDNKNKIITPLEINRDTMVNVDIYDNDGNYLTQGLEQLTMQYSYGTSPSKACNLTKEKVSDLLGRKRIDGVISLTMDGIEPIVDMIDGVTLQLQTDETILNPTYTQGAIVHLDGTSAVEFVHTRDVEVRGSNIDRMSRQTQFMIALFENIKRQGNSIIETMEDAAGDYLYKDLDADTIAHITQYDYADNVLYLPGENDISGQHDEFYVDEEKLTELILDLFYLHP